MDKISLVLEGGGFRCCYVAGTLKWLLDHNIHISYSSSVSSGAACAFYYHANDPQQLHDFSINTMLDKKLISFANLVKEGGFVGYQYMVRKYVIPTYHSVLEKIKNSNAKMEICVYNTETGSPEYFDDEHFDADAQILKTTCVLPISGKMVEIKGHKYFDGGIEVMIPIQRAIDNGCEKHLIIVTKDANYVRKPNPFYLRIIFYILYHSYPKLLKALKKRHINYYEQMSTINNLVASNKALLIRPSNNCGVGRFKGNKESMEKLFETGYNDMENRKEEILDFLK